MDRKTRKQQNNEITFHCNNCKKDITHFARIKCCVCADFDLCLECFRKGVEIYPHQNNHSYRIVRDLHFPLLTVDWGADEEILLLEAVEHCGMDNWLDISEYVSTKSPLECKEHYLKCYLETQASPLPDFSTAYATVHPDCTTNILKQTKRTFDIKSEKDKEKQPSHGTNNTKITKDNHECSFNALRREFEFEPFNNAELNIMDMKFLPTDSRDDRERKFKKLEQYYRMYVERKRIRDIIMNNKLLDGKKIKANERKKAKDEHDIWLNYRPFYSVLGRDEYDKFIKSIAEVNEIERRIKQLKTWRTLGYLTVDEARNTRKTVGRKGLRTSSTGIARKGAYHH